MPGPVAKDILKDWVVEALEASDGRAAHHVAVAKYIWANYQAELEASGDLFFAWQYDLRWAAGELRREGRLRPKPKGDKGPWRLT
jgi:hypothetical protein